MTKLLVLLFTLPPIVGACTMHTQAAPAPCVVDAYEPNDSEQARKSLGAIEDDPSDLPGVENLPQKVQKSLSIHAAADVDWLDVEVHDTGAGGNPDLSVIVSEGFEATAWWSCGGPAATVSCGLGAAVTDDPELAGEGCATRAQSGAPPQLTMKVDCAGTDTDNGVVHVRVHALEAADACRSYTLTVIAD